MTDARFILDPNLPQNPVKMLIIGKKYADLLSNMLSKLGICVFSVPCNPKISPEIAFHADMSICHTGGAGLVAAKAVYKDLLNLVNLGVELVCAEGVQAEEYPSDIGLNVCIIGDRLLHKLSCTDVAIIRAANENHLRKYNVNQGYTKCSVCVVDRNRIITADAGIHKTASALGIESLLISSGGIVLSGYGTGFIGGSCVKLSRDTIAFTGSLDRHPDKRRILDFLESAGVRPIYLTDAPIFDVGSIIPLMESI